MIPTARLCRVYTDVSKQRHGVRSGVYIAETEAKMSLKLSDDFNTLLAVISGIKKSVT